MLVRRLPDPDRSGRSVRGRRRRSGVVLLGVLIVIVILSLIAYQFSDRMATEFNAANNAHRNTQVRAFAASGIYFAAAVLSNPDNANMADAGIYDNEMFRDVALPDGENLGAAGRFTLVAPSDPTDNNGSPFRAGVTDESGKINLNAMMKIDPSGQTLQDMLTKLPNMTPEIAASIVFWLDPSATPREGAADSGYYQGLNPSYSCKNAPLDSLDELLLVQGVTRELLYGSDLNHNNLPDANETSSTSNGIDRGWSAFLTVSSRESNRNAQGQPLVYLNDTDLSTLYQNLQTLASEDVAKFVIMYRQYGASTTAGSSQSVLGSIASLLGGSSKTTTTATNTVQGTLSSYEADFTKNGGRQIATIYDLIGTQVSIPGKAAAKGAKTPPTVVYSSPFNDPDALVAPVPDGLARHHDVAGRGASRPHQHPDRPARGAGGLAGPDRRQRADDPQRPSQAFVGRHPERILQDARLADRGRHDLAEDAVEPRQVRDGQEQRLQRAVGRLLREQARPDRPHRGDHRHDLRPPQNRLLARLDRARQDDAARRDQRRDGEMSPVSCKAQPSADRLRTTMCPRLGYALRLTENDYDDEK